jgi:outer membrane protein, adhesin transport system
VQRFSEARADETMFDIELRVTNAYYDTVRALRRTMILERGLNEHRMLVDSISRRVDQEVSPRVDLELARARTAQLEEQLATAVAQRDASLQRLRELIGDPSYTIAAIPFYDPSAHHPTTDTAVQEATTCSPTRKRAQAEALVARADAKLAEAQYMPRVSAIFSSNEVTGERVGVTFRAGTNGGLSQFEAASAARQRRQAAELQAGAADRDRPRPDQCRYRREPGGPPAHRQQRPGCACLARRHRQLSAPVRRRPPLLARRDECRAGNHPVGACRG